MRRRQHQLLAASLFAPPVSLFCSHQTQSEIPALGSELGIFNRPEVFLASKYLIQRGD